MEYKLVGEPDESRLRNQKTAIIIKLALTDTMIKSITEIKAYNFISFLAEFGGALGLFVGWSLLSVFDLVEVFRNIWPDLKN